MSSKTERDSQTQKTNSWLPKGMEAVGRGGEKKKKKRSLMQFHVNLFTNYTIKLLEYFLKKKKKHGYIIRASCSGGVVGRDHPPPKGWGVAKNCLESGK